MGLIQHNNILLLILWIHLASHYDGGDAGGVHALRDGAMTMWTTNPGAVSGSACGFASPELGLELLAANPSWLQPYVNKTMYCAANNVLFKKGIGCGRCYRIWYDENDGGTDPGRSGKADIQIVDLAGGSDKAFDCYIDAFDKITGADTGSFPVTYRRIPCKQPAPALSAAIIDGDNAWYVKVLFAGGIDGVRRAKIKVGPEGFNMQRVVGATWSASLAGGPTNKKVRFILRMANKEKRVIRCYNEVWPVPKGYICEETAR